MSPVLENDRWLLPEGIEELLPEEARRLEQTRRAVLDLFARWGYEQVEPPLIEYLESLLTGTGHDLDLQTFKLTDQLTGRLMGVRADMTPQVARIDAHALKREVPTRLCYLGPVLHTRPDGFARSRSPLQVGAELYGHAGPESDVEVIQLLVATLAAAGVDSPYLDLGHVGIFRGLMGRAGLEPEQEEALFDALQRKAVPDLRQLLAEADVEERVGSMLEALAGLNGGPETLDEAETVLAGAGEEVAEALARLRAVAEGLKARLPELSLHFDLAELRGFNYHTGVVFGAFLPGRGSAIAEGGRYDDIGRVFGRSRAATGFSADLRTLIALGPAQQEPVRGIFAPWEDDPALVNRIAELRAQGERVVTALPGQPGGAAEMGCDRSLARKDGTWQVVALEPQS